VAPRSPSTPARVRVSSERSELIFKPSAAFVIPVLPVATEPPKLRSEDGTDATGRLTLLWGEAVA
jgi:hypothetical protein